MGEVRYVVGGVRECGGRGGGVWKGPLLRSGCLYIYLQLTLNEGSGEGAACIALCTSVCNLGNGISHLE